MIKIAARRVAVGVIWCGLLAGLGTVAALAAPPSFFLTTLAGTPGVAGSDDGVGAAARFSDLYHLAVDGVGNVYVPDGSSHTIRKITAAGVVSTLAGMPGQAGSADGAGAVARFCFPRGVAVDLAGNVYVADTGNSTIRKISPAGVVTTLAGTAAPDVGGGSADGTGAAAGFQFPYALTVDAAGNVYVADSLNSTIRKITPDGRVTTLAGSPREPGRVDGTGSAARFNNPSGITIDAAGMLYVADSNNLIVRQVTAGGVVSTAAMAQRWAVGIAAAADGSVYIAGSGNSTIARLSAEGVDTVAGVFGLPGRADGPKDIALLNNPLGVAVDREGTLYVADHNNQTIRKGTPIRITWPTPAPVPFGTFMSDAQRNATANVPGTFLYDFSNGTFYPPGDQTLHVTFMPTGGVTSSEVKATVILTVTKRTPVITWPQPAAIDYGTLLSTTQLHASVDVPGTLEYQPAFGTLLPAGRHTLRVTFTPSESASAYGATAEVMLVVNDVAVVPLQVIAQPADQTLLAGSPANFTLSLSGSPPPKFFWQESQDGGRTWNYVSDGDNYSGTETATLTIAHVTAAMDSYLYRCMATTVGSGLWSNTAALHVTTSIAYMGGYFGTFAHGGTWSIFVGAPSRFVAYLPWRKSAIVEELTVKADGTFTVQCYEHVASGSGLNAAVLTLTGSITAPSQSLRPVAAQLVEIGEALTGGFATSGAFTAFSGNFFTASALGVEQGELYLVAGFGGELQAVVITPTLVDGARGSLTASGSQVLATAEGRQLSLAINPSAQSVNATLSEDGAKGTSLSGGETSTATAFVPKLQFAGLAQSIPSTSRSVNIATRAYCSTDNKVTIGGFVVSGSASKRVLVRAVGPSLTAQGLAAGEVLLDPTIEVHDAIHGNSIVATNDNWGDNLNAAEINSVASSVGASALLGSDSKSSAALLNLTPGVYSFVVNGKAATSGVVLLEVYDADATRTGTTFANIATRAYATTGNGVTIGGFVINGNAPKHVLLRAVGPTLTKQGLGLGEVLADPMIELHDALHDNAVVATNDDWGDNPNAAALSAAGARIGATPFDQTDAKSAALLVTLQPGVYSFIASGKGAAPSGIVLVEVYDAD